MPQSSPLLASLRRSATESQDVLPRGGGGRDRTVGGRRGWGPTGPSGTRRQPRSRCTRPPACSRPSWGSSRRPRRSLGQCAGGGTADDREPPSLDRAVGRLGLGRSLGRVPPGAFRPALVVAPVAKDRRGGRGRSDERHEPGQREEPREQVGGTEVERRAPGHCRPRGTGRHRWAFRQRPQAKTDDGRSRGGGHRAPACSPRQVRGSRIRLVVIRLASRPAGAGEEDRVTVAGQRRNSTGFPTVVDVVFVLARACRPGGPSKDVRRSFGLVSGRACSRHRAACAPWGRRRCAPGSSAVAAAGSGSRATGRRGAPPWSADPRTWSAAACAAAC